MSIQIEMANDLAEAEIDYGSQKMTYNGVQYDCLPSGVDRDVQIEVGGNPVALDATIVVRNALFPDSTPPASGDTVTYNSRDYVVASAQDIHQTLTRLMLVNPNA